jgi:hypothetical protein
MVTILKLVENVFGYAQCNVATIPMVRLDFNLLKEIGYFQCNVATIPTW